MNKQEIQHYKHVFGVAAHRLDDSGVEYSLARELMALLGYDRWENFSNVLDKLKIACQHSKIELSDHSRDVTKMVSRQASDFESHGFEQMQSKGDNSLIRSEKIQRTRRIGGWKELAYAS